MAKVVTASSAGTAFEWYDFFIFGALASVIGQVFFSGLSDTMGVIAALGLFAAGFAFRPLGAIVFGAMGDRIGRKATFLITVSLMGGATFAIGLLPTYASAGLVAPILLIILRICQGMAIGGEYGGAAIYVAEHADDDKRGAATGWIQASAAFGLIAALLVIYFTRTSIGEDAFLDWGWRVPFLVSILLLAISVWMRFKLNESPAYQKLKEEGAVTSTPLREAFAEKKSAKKVLTAFFGFMAAQGALWYCAFFYVQVFLEKNLGIPGAEVNWIILIVTIVSAPLYVFFGWLSDRLGRKPVMVGGMLIGLVAFFPGFHAIADAVNPQLSRAQAESPVVIVTDLATCSSQFDPTGTAQFTTACDIASKAVIDSGVGYQRVASDDGTTAITIGETAIAVAEAGTVDMAGLDAALRSAGYPLAADLDEVDWTTLYFWMLVFTVAATALYGPMAAALVEMFPTRIRYTAMSLPYHVGTGWVGGFLPVTAFTIVAATGDIYAGLWYPVFFIALSVVCALVFWKERHGQPLH
ncbi:MFS transporter [Sphingomicrobium astaxanthinifaciens]|uniref:MFS transporter n=1 Tax=Sphingomicrobium astaxanthinifaciens TaxID=1227949 RepID=UPI001FCAB60B|nr:MFS transporter [Sphingomicrobium astaxanthinifaciens]MCJ7420775.1 MFS transporter [Sphingomicrobium astaxanthinifaciens]